MIYFPSSTRHPRGELSKLRRQGSGKESAMRTHTDSRRGDDDGRVSVA